MKFEKNNKYFTIGVYTVWTVLTIIALTFVLFNLKAIGGYLAKFIGVIWVLVKPLVFGFIIAYLLDPLVSMYDKKWVGVKLPFKRKKSTSEKGPKARAVPTALAYVTTVAFLGLIVLIIVINARDVIGVLQYSRIHETIPVYVQSFQRLLQNVDAATSNVPFMEGNIEIVSKLTGYIETFITALSDKLIAFLKSLGAQLVPIGLGTVIAFYLLKDKKRLLVIWQRLIHLMVPERIRSEVLDVGRDIDYVFSGYIRGQILDAVIMATLISVALTVIGIDFAVIIGIISGIFNLIPYFGPVVGFILAGFIGFIGPDPAKGIYAIIAVMALQQLDGWVIVPRVMGQTVKLHPIIVLLAIVIGGQLLGLVGFLLGVPVAGFIRLCIIRYMGDVFSTEEH